MGPLRVFTCAGLAAVVHCAVDAQPILATNDGRATFEAGTFRLPSLSDAKDVYTIILELSDGTTKKLLLPAGSTGLIVGTSALPPGPWKWRYVLQPERVDNFLAHGAIEQRITYSDLARYENATPLEWDHITTAASYRVLTKTDKGMNHTAPPDWGDESKVDLSVEEHVDERTKRGHYDLPISAGARVQWRVQALDKDGRIIGQTDPRVVAADGPWSTAMNRAGFKLQRSDTLSSKDAGKSALVGYASTEKDGKKDSAYQAEFAVIWTGAQGRNYHGFYPRASLEARLHSSGPDKDTDALKLRFGGYKILDSVEGEIAANLKYETESSKDTKKALIELAFSPTFFPFGAYLPRPSPDRTGPSGNYRIGDAPRVLFLPQLTLGVDVGKTLEVGSSNETKKSLFRQWADLRLDFYLNFLADALRIPGATLYGQTKRWHLSGNNPSTYHLSSAGLNFQLTKELSLDVNYSVGADAPAFKFSRNAGIGLGLKF